MLDSYEPSYVLAAFKEGECMMNQSKELLRMVPVLVFRTEDREVNCEDLVIRYGEYGARRG